MKERIQQLEKEIVELKAQLEDSEQEIEEGQYWGNGGWVSRIDRVEGDKVWLYNINANSPNNAPDRKAYLLEVGRKLSEDEIKEALVAEAKRRGLVKGAKVKQRYEDDKIIEDTLVSGNYEYDSSGDVLRVRSESMYGMWVYRRGNWAEIVEDTVTIEINGYKAEFHEHYVRFGCAKIENSIFEDLVKCIEREALTVSGDYGNRAVTGVKIGKGVFTLEHIKQIAEYYQEEV